jgi:hypothetical protein
MLISDLAEQQSIRSVDYFSRTLAQRPKALKRKRGGKGKVDFGVLSHE